ncbi:uncharacterized protein LOC129767030 [Toxorhynchites rutilus septentrionalis]|uniref:uncharacterized protein LOC129767030 n=1 Tax=Toxorhynchites rutilus septentrionalis TaxID=329112 RepID=UPI00247A962C|nr:uncharacterized protein LOC129767030 [Toxorhynchites rutilus septentrionalis]
MNQTPKKVIPEKPCDYTLQDAQTLDENRTDCVQCDRRNGDESMVQCDGCQLWWHFSCAGVSGSIKDRSWSCTKCHVDCRESIASTSRRSRMSNKSAKVNLQLEKLEKLQAIETKFVEEKYKLLESHLEPEDEHGSVLSKRSRTSKQSRLSRIATWVSKCAEQEEEAEVPTSKDATPMPPVPPTYVNAVAVSSHIPHQQQLPVNDIHQSPLERPSLPKQRSAPPSMIFVPEFGKSETDPKQYEQPTRHAVFNRIAETVPLAQSTPGPVQLIEQHPTLEATNVPALLINSPDPERVSTDSPAIMPVFVRAREPESALPPPTTFASAPAALGPELAPPPPVPAVNPFITTVPQTHLASLPREVSFPVPPGRSDNNPMQTNIPPNINDVNIEHLMKQFGSIALSPSQSPLFNMNLATFAPTPSQLAARQVMPRDLPLFSGNPADWPVFMSSFINTTLTCGFSSAENICRLQRSLKGAAYEAVQSRLLLPESVPHIMETLQLLYGRPELLISALLEKVRATPPPKMERFQTIIDFGMSIQTLCDHLEVAGQSTHLSNPSLLAELVAKLPPHLQMEWGSYLQGFPEVNLKTFGYFMSSVVKAVSKVTVYANSSVKSGAIVKNTMHTKGNMNTHQGDMEDSASIPSFTNREEARPCPACKDTGHRIQNCSTFTSLSVADRWKYVQSGGLCRNCLNAHGRRSCRKPSNCGINGCEFRHHPLLHSSRSSSDVKALVNTAENHSHRLVKQTLLFRIIPVTLHGPKGAVDTFAFLDDGSSLTLIEDSLARELGVDGVTMPLCLLWTANVTRVEKESQLISLAVSSTGGRKFTLEEVQTVKELSLPTQSLSYEYLSKQYTHLKGIPVISYSKAVPKLLIGVNNLNLMVPLKIREGSRQEPIATKTRLGWCIYGGRASNGQKLSVNCHACGCESDQALHDIVKEFVTMDEVGVLPGTPLLSKSDERAQQLLQDTTVRVGSHFETGLLWKFDHIELPDSYNMALRRLECLERRMHRNPDLKQVLQRQLEDYQSKGYAHRATEKELNSADLRRVWYLPLGAVVNPRKPTKVRMIWDARAAVNGISLNSVLLKGPDQLISLPGVLVRFRQFNVAVSADIREMFHQILIRKEDRNSQRFLWRNNPSETPDVFLMDVATFGSTCSPASAQFIKNKNAAEFKELYPRAVEGIVKNHYVDDSLESYESVEDAIKVSREMRLVHEQGGFELRNWLSNNNAVLEGLGETNLGEDKSFAADKHNDPERVLGLLWSTQEDTFSFATEMKQEIVDLLNSNESPTKRQLLRCLMSLFDPLGLLSLFVVHGKILLQEVWRSGTHWDEKVKNELHQRWKKWINLLVDVRDLKIPRCYFPGATHQRYRDLQLHIFVDASESAYCAAAYFRTLNPDGLPECILVAAKTKVTPLKTQSVPRLELLAAVLGGRLAQFINENHTLSITRKVLWSDSATVLAWLRSDHRRYKQFVACRIGELLTISDVTNWRWVPSKQNPADLATKWGNGPDLSANSVWFKGPSFLRLAETEWPKENLSSKQTDEELRPCYAHKANPIPERLVEMERFSKLTRAIRAVAYVYRFIGNLKQNIVGKERLAGPLTSEELQKAENLLIREAQWQRYPDEMMVLIRNRTKPIYEKTGVGKNSSLYQLCPTLDEQGILRVDGRIGAAPNVEKDTKYPIILPSNHPLTYLVLDNYHRRYHHGNSETVVNEVRQHYHVSALRSAVRKVAKACQWCRVHKSQPNIPRMAPLPLARIASFVRPFTYIGLDFFGPLTVKIGRSNAKRWIALFTGS